MIGVFFLVATFAAVLEAGPVNQGPDSGKAAPPDDGLMNMRHVRHKRAYTVEMPWAYEVPQTALMFGMASCQDLEDIEPYRESDMQDFMVYDHNQARERWNSEIAALSCSTVSEITTDLVWDTDLAKMSQLWANMCTFGHGYRDASTCDTSITLEGQNVFWSMAPWENAMDTMLMTVADWENVEKPYYDKCTKTCSIPPEMQGTVADCGHYEALVNPAITKVGCAFTDACHKCTKMYMQDTDYLGPVDTLLDYYMAYYNYPEHQAMYVCAYA